MDSDPKMQQSGALAGLRVIDFTHYIAGPFASMMLADAGADVIKVEKPKGDDQRHFPPLEASLDGEGVSFLWTNRNKRSITLDLKTPAGLRLARCLVDGADVVVENFSARVMRQYGLDYETVAPANPKLVYCSITAFGRAGPSANRPGFDTIIQAESGFMSLNGHPGHEGVRTGPAIMDISTGMMASNAILLALATRTRSGAGQYIDVPLFDTAILMSGFVAAQHLFSGKIPARNGNRSSDSVPSGVFNAADGPIFVTSTSTTLFRKLFGGVLGRHDLADDPVLQSSAGRLKERARIEQALSETLSAQSRSHWLERFNKAGIPAGEVRTLPEALGSPEAKERGQISTIPHPTADSVPNIGLPMYFSQATLVPPIAAPRLGEHTDAIARDILGLNDQQLATARDAGAFG